MQPTYAVSISCTRFAFTNQWTVRVTFINVTSYALPSHTFRLTRNGIYYQEGTISPLPTGGVYGSTYYFAPAGAYQVSVIGANGGAGAGCGSAAPVATSTPTPIIPTATPTNTPTRTPSPTPEITAWIRLTAEITECQPDGLTVVLQSMFLRQRQQTGTMTYTNLSGATTQSNITLNFDANGSATFQGPQGTYTFASYPAVEPVTFSCP